MNRGTMSGVKDGGNGLVSGERVKPFKERGVKSHSPSNPTIQSKPSATHSAGIEWPRGWRQSSRLLPDAQPDCRRHSRPLPRLVVDVTGPQPFSFSYNDQPWVIGMEL